MSAEALAAAMVLDAALGEPDCLWRRWPHPAVLMGRLIGWMDERFNRAPCARLRGAAVVAALVLSAAALGCAIGQLPLAPLWEALIAAALLAQRSLVDHVAAVACGLRSGPEPGRAAVARIVGRDTQAMDQPATARAAIESAAENLSDGIIAPVFWFLVAGLPGILVYKVINTADSMIGYRTPRHEAFGWAAARLDDLFNLLPARLTAALILLAAGKPLKWSPVIRDARLHRSPNAGWPEAAMAVALDIRLSGPRSYHGEMRDFPWVWPEGRANARPHDIDRTCRILWQGWTLAFAAVTLLSLV